MQTAELMVTDAIIIKSISTAIADNFLRDDGILVVQIKEGIEVDILGVKENFEATFRMTESTRCLTLIDARCIFTSTQEARDYTAMHASHYRIAHAALINSLANRIVGNFYINFNKPCVPTKLFTSNNEAIKWLNTFR